jgi:hypothetical protein
MVSKDRDYLHRTGEDSAASAVDKDSASPLRELNGFARASDPADRRARAPGKLRRSDSRHAT